MAIKREIYVTRRRVEACLDVTYGSDLLPIQLEVADYEIPIGAIAVAYANSNGSETKKILCEISDNVISFNPEKGFFATGHNTLQLRVTYENKSLFSYKCDVKCHESFSDDDTEEALSQPTLVEQLLTEVGNTKNMAMTAQEDIDKLDKNMPKHDLKDNVTTFESEDFLDSEEVQLEWTDVEVLESGEKHSSIFAKVSAMFKNVRFLYKKFTELNDNLLEKIYPIGSVYLSAVYANPKDLFGFGEWEQIKDKFLLSSGDTYKAGTTGGSDTIDLEHLHQEAFGVNGNYIYAKTDSLNTKGEFVKCRAEIVGNAYTGFVSNTSEALGLKSILPPYLTVYMWKRTA